MRAMYEFCGAFFSELKASGVRHAVVSPGARSTPLVVSADRAGLEMWVQIDERSAGFFAVGLAKAVRGPVALICTSGTAAANYLPAVVEANRSGVPLVVLTADRPPELRGWGSNQTIDQVGIYGGNPRWTVELPVASESDAGTARRYAARAAAVAAAAPAGPVHLNFPLRRPLAPDESLPDTFAAPDREIAVQTGHDASRDAVAAVAGLIAAHPRGLVLAGAVNPGSIDVEDVLAVAARAGWPILAEPTSQLRLATPETQTAVISTASYLVQDGHFESAHRPDAILLLGSAPPQRSLQNWLRDQAGCRVMVVGEGTEWLDESLSFTDVVREHPGRLFAALRSDLTEIPDRDRWQQDWAEADAAAGEAISRGLIESEMFEGRVVTALAGVVPDDAAFYVGNSMSVRDVNLYWPPRDEAIDIYSNRGASGIDGVVSSALGVAAGTGEPVVLMLGDLSLLHDLSGLLAAVRLRVPLIVVVVNNDGGGIFSFLPFAGMGEEIRFRDLFHTPHGADLGAMAGGMGAAHRLVASSVELQQAVIEGLEAEGPTVIEVDVDVDKSVALHRSIDAAVAQALAREL
jgi:2-succinyl-5-enolpyruvyl-6-hydroxy-3-cyclohexene-1-carboxylate synthase